MPGVSFGILKATNPMELLLTLNGCLSMEAVTYLFGSGVSQSFAAMMNTYEGSSLQYIFMFLAPANLEATLIVFVATSPVFGFLMLIFFLEVSFLYAIVTYPFESVLYVEVVLLSPSTA